MSIKYKLLFAMLFVLISTLGVCAFFTWETLLEDKKLAVMDLNQALLHGITSDLKVELKGRLDELQVALPRAFAPDASDARGVFQGLSRELPDELLAATFYRKTDRGYETVREFRNAELLAKRQLPMDLATQLAQSSPLPFDFLADQPLVLLNRSLATAPSAPILTLLMTGTSLSEAGQGIFIAVDYASDFLRKRLMRSDLAEVFLIFRSGGLLAHRSVVLTTKHAIAPFPHPIVARLKNKQFPRESVELQVEGEPQLVNVAETGFGDLLAVAQVRKRDALAPVRTLGEKGALVAALSLSLAVIISLLFGARLSSRLNRVGTAVDKIAQGDLAIETDTKSADEVGRLARRVQTMASRLGELMVSHAESARDAGEGETARVVQSTLLTEPKLSSAAFELASLQRPSPAGGSNFWDAHHGGRFLTLIIGDTSAKGVPGALTTAIARGSFHALCGSDPAQPPSPTELLSSMNGLLYRVCLGKLTLAACVGQIDLESGELVVASAAHAGPIRLREKANDVDVERLSADGPLLGAKPEASYKATRCQIALGDRLVLHTMGVTEARGEDGEPWGKNGLRAALGEDLTASAATLKARIEAAFEKHTGGHDIDDDATLAVFHWKGKVSSTQRETYVEDSPSLWEAEAEADEENVTPAQAPLPAPKVETEAAAAEETAPPVPDLEELTAGRDAYLYEGKEWNEEETANGRKAA